MTYSLVLVTADEAAFQVCRRKGTIWRWVHEGHLTPAAEGPNGAHLFRLEDVFAAERRARHARGGRPPTRRGREIVDVNPEDPQGQDWRSQ